MGSGLIRLQDSSVTIVRSQNRKDSVTYARQFGYKSLYPGPFGYKAEIKEI